MSYRNNTLWMITLIEKSGSLNAMKDFFAQLSHVREVDKFALINSISVSKPVNLINRSVLLQPWMNLVSLVDIRNIVVFMLWKEFKIMLDTNEPYVDKGCTDTFYNEVNDRKPNANDKLLVLLETAYYINQIFTIRNQMEIPQNWDIFPNYVLNVYKSKGLISVVNDLFDLYQLLILGDQF
ncbi:MAG: hypothetical protein CL881_03900 [Dehalococcoidia bacterium]|mgnify:CR=1 FL=1|nr:hypothetical protein [Dehalococcoidia bacterium]|tara:strand:+ start:178 stop:720 length:543 start_codon:yes stop_codon:yes gene_type:complete